MFGNVWDNASFDAISVGSGPGNNVGGRNVDPSAPGYGTPVSKGGGALPINVVHPVGVTPQQPVHGVGTTASVGPPTITNVNVAADTLGRVRTLYVTGSGFSATGLEVSIDGTPAVVQAKSDTRLTVMVPNTTAPGTATVMVVTGEGVATGTFPMAAAASASGGASFSSVTPSSGAAGDTITVVGSNLSGAKFTIGGISAQSVAVPALSSQAAVQVPAGVSTGATTITATRTDGTKVSAPFTVTSTEAGGKIVPITQSQWIADIEDPSSPVFAQAWNALTGTAPTGFSLSQLNANVQPIAAALGTSIQAAEIFAALAALGSTFLQAATPNVPFTAADIFAAVPVLGANQTALESAYASAVYLGPGPNSTGGTATAAGGGDYYGGGLSDGSGDVNPATGQPYSSGGASVAQPLPVAVSSGSMLPWLLGAGLLGLFLFEREKKGTASSSSSSTTNASPGA